jgi:HD-GYP domain-containing protein (c-di-GMP phosphodiesterase class II)
MTLVIDSYVHHHKLPLKLKSILVGELFLARKLKYPVYVLSEGLFTPVIGEGSVPTKEQITTLIKGLYREAYLYQEDVESIKSNLESALIKITRSLSVGDPVENGNKGIKLLTLNLNNLYDNPHRDELLIQQFQSTQNLSKFLIENKKLHSQFFKTLGLESFHFTLAQPMLSSMLLLSFLQSIHLFHEREIENLFMTSYLKDIGFAMIPDEKYDLKALSEKDRELFTNHADFSFNLLDGRIPLSKTHLNIIKNHHFLNDHIKAIITGQKRTLLEDEMIMGLESTLVAVFDILVAMTSDRPYRKGLTLYQALEVIKKIMADDYPQEFKALVAFLRHFFKN